MCDADFNQDGAVGLNDVGELLQRIGELDKVFDLDGDGVVALPDVGMALNALGELVGPSGLACAGTEPCEAL